MVSSSGDHSGSASESICFMSWIPITWHAESRVPIAVRTAGIASLAGGPILPQAIHGNVAGSWAITFQEFHQYRHTFYLSIQQR